MILKIDGNINRYYVQTLCMVFFPGASFGENEEPGEGVPEVHLRLGEDENGVYTATATIKLNDKSCEASAVVTPDDELHISSPDALAAGRAIFSAGKALLGHIPPWGILTGVRPAKIAAGLLRSGNGILKSKKILVFPPTGPRYPCKLVVAWLLSVSRRRNLWLLCFRHVGL